MGCAYSTVGRITHTYSEKLAQHEPKQAAPHQEWVDGTEPVEVVLLGDQSQAIVPRIEALRDSCRSLTGPVRIVRHSPTADGLQETTVSTGGHSCTILDISLLPGQLDTYRGCLRHAVAFIFVVDLATYDEPESSPTSLRKSLKEWEKLCSTTWCTQGVPVILLFDNADVFKKKLAYDAFGARYIDYDGDDDDDIAARDYLLMRFMHFKTDRHGAVYVHFTSYEDKHIARVLFAAVQDIVLQRIIEESPSPPPKRRHRIFGYTPLHRVK